MAPINICGISITTRDLIDNNWDEEVFSEYGPEIPEKNESLRITASEVKQYVLRSIEASEDNYVSNYISIDNRKLIFSTIEYYSEIRKFKQANGYKVGDKVNGDKRSAILIKAVMRHRPMQIDRDFPDYVHKHVEANATLSFRFALITIGVSPRSMPARTRKDYLYCIQNFSDIEPEVLFMTTSFLRFAFSGSKWCGVMHRTCQKVSSLFCHQTP